MIARYRAKAEAVQNRSLPPVAGEERRRFLKQAEEDFMDYSLVGAAEWSVEEGHLVLRLRSLPLFQAEVFPKAGSWSFRKSPENHGCAAHVRLQSSQRFHPSQIFLCCLNTQNPRRCGCARPSGRSGDTSRHTRR